MAVMRPSSRLTWAWVWACVGRSERWSRREGGAYEAANGVVKAYGLMIEEVGEELAKQQRVLLLGRYARARHESIDDNSRLLKGKS
jgi:hypothetical protein